MDTWKSMDPVRRRVVVVGASVGLLLGVFLLFHRGSSNVESFSESVYMFHPSEYYDHSKLAMVDPCSQDLELHDVPLVPKMTVPEQTLFKKYLYNASYYFETGSGGSTYLASQAENLLRIDVVESDINWMEILRTSEPVNFAECGKKMLHFHYVNINANTTLGGWGTPKDRSLQSMWGMYAGAISLYAGSPWKPKPDLVFIDGRFRVACAAHAYRVVPDNATIMIHDYKIRKHYKIIEKILEPIEEANNLAAFRLRKRTPDRLRLAEKLIMEYIVKPA